MAVHKATRSKSLAQLQRRSFNPRQILRPKNGLRISPAGSQPLQTRLHARKAAQPHIPIEDPQLKTQLLETLKHLNRGFGVVLAGFDKLQRQNRLRKPGIFPYECLHGYRNRAEELRALANRDLLRLYAEREDRDATRFGHLRTQ